MNNALIGYTGYVGSTLRGQTRFGSQFRSTDIARMDGGRFDTVVCAGAPAKKWLANAQPEQDRASIDGLMEHLTRITCRRLVLVSTVDVFREPHGVDEDSPVEENGLHPYGLHRRLLEKFVAERFPDALVVRLPGLVGPGLRKNVVFDLLHDNNLDQVDSRAVFQFYPMVNLWFDIQRALDAGLRLVHLTAEPLSVADVALQGFGRPLEHSLGGTPPAYNMRSRHAALFGGSGAYQYSRRESLQAIRAYAQSEPRRQEAPAP